MADVFLTGDVKKLLHGKFVVVMGGSVHRSIYKDIVMLLQKNKYLSDSQLRAKGEASFENDKLLLGGQKGPMNTSNNYREVRQYLTDNHLVEFYFLTRCYNNYVEAVLKKLSEDPKPDVLVISTIVWDLTRYGNNGVVEYKENLQKFFDRVKETLTAECIVIWDLAAPVSKEAKGGIFTPELDHLRNTLSLEILEANHFAHHVAIKNGYNVLDLHFYLRLQLHRRAEDGIHWDMTAHRRISNLILTFISEQWGVPLPGNGVKRFGEKYATVKVCKTENKPAVANLPKISMTNPLTKPAQEIKQPTPAQKPRPKKKAKRKLNNWVGRNVQNFNMIPNNWNVNSNNPPIVPTNFQRQQKQRNNFVHHMQPVQGVNRYHPYRSNPPFSNQHVYQPEFW